MTITRQTLFERDTLQIGLFEARPTSDACGAVERQRQNAVVLPIGGVFSKHDAPGRHVIGTPSHAVFVAADTPYRIGYPGAIGDRALTLHFDAALAPEPLHRRNGEALPSNGLLPAQAMLQRNLLLARLKAQAGEALEVETLGLDLLHLAFAALRPGEPPAAPSALARRRRAVERVKEAVALAPAEPWNVAKLGAIANLSPFHLCHVFRQTTGTSLYDYVLRERLARALDAVLGGADDLTAVALDAGFASHSHFTARFRRFFGCTPASLRRHAPAGQIGNLRKIVTARRSLAS